MSETNETQLEQTFANLAYTNLRDKAQGLLDYLIGFQILKVEDEGKRAVGIFGFEIEDKVYYASIFFLNGEVRGMESLYSVDSDLFVPLTEAWINSIINKKTVAVGETDTRSRNERGVRVPSYIRLKTLPSSHGAVNLKLGEDMLSKMAGARSDETGLDLPEALRSAGATEMFKKAVFDIPKLREAFEKFYDVSDLTAAPAVVKVAAEKKEKPVIVIDSVTADGVDSLNDEQRKTIMEGGVGVIDKRPEVDKSLLYTSETKGLLFNPEGGGLYDVLWSDGSVDPAFICPNSDPEPTVFVMSLQTGRYCEIQPRKVFCVRQYPVGAFIDELDKAGVKPSAVKPNDVCVFLSNTGQGTGGFCIKEKTDGLDGTTVFTTNDHYYMKVRDAQFSSYPTGYGQGPSQQRHGRVDPNDRVQTILVVANQKGEPQYTKNKLIINDKHFYAIKLNTFSLKDGDYPMESYSDNKSEMLLEASCFGDEDTVIKQLTKSACAIKVWSTDHNITIDDGRSLQTLSKKAAYEHLMINHGLGYEDATIAIDDARTDAVVYHVKYASQFDPFPTFPPEDVDLSSGNELNQFFPGQIPVNLRLPKTPADNREFYMYQSPFGGGGHEGNGVSQGSQDPLSSVQQAAETGQKEVFDASVMGSLLKSHAPTELVDRFLPTIITGMDRLGRILFLIFWHYDEFEDRYNNESDLSELIDNLKASFSDIGDIVLFLKKRSLAGDPDHYGVGGGENDIEGDI